MSNINLLSVKTIFLSESLEDAKEIDAELIVNPIVVIPGVSTPITKKV